MMERKAPGCKKHDHNVYGTFFAAKTKHISLGQQHCESRLASAWYQEVTGVLERSQKEYEETKSTGAKQTSSPALECNGMVEVSDAPAANCERDMQMKVPGVDVDNDEPMLLSGNVTAFDEVKGAVCDEMVELTDNAACNGVIPDVVMLLSDGDSLFNDDDVDNLPVKGTTTTLVHAATLLQPGEMEIIQEPSTEDSGTLDNRWGVPGLGHHHLEQQPGWHFGSHFQNPRGGYGGGGRGGGCDFPIHRWGRNEDCWRGRDCGAMWRETGGVAV
jgi:hypothetical protein